MYLVGIRTHKKYIVHNRGVLFFHYGLRTNVQVRSTHMYNNNNNNILYNIRFYYYANDSRRLTSAVPKCNLLPRRYRRHRTRAYPIIKLILYAQLFMCDVIIIYYRYR